MEAVKRYLPQPFLDQSFYKMSANPRGFCLLINNVKFDSSDLVERIHSVDDANELEKVFEWLGFSVQRKNDLTAKDMISCFKLFAKKESDMKYHDALVVIILTHGYDSDHLYGIDGRVIKTSDVLTCFNNKNCVGMRSKPKVFFIEACRGVMCKKSANDGRRSSIQIGDIRKLPERLTGLKIPKDVTYQDMFISYSTAPDCSSNYENDGSWYCTELCENLRADSHAKHLEEILIQVNRNVYKKENADGVKQLPTYENRGFSKKLYFNPNYYDETA